MMMMIVMLSDDQVCLGSVRSRLRLRWGSSYGGYLSFANLKSGEILLGQYGCGVFL